MLSDQTVDGSWRIEERISEVDWKKVKSVGYEIRQTSWFNNFVRSVFFLS